MKAFLFLLVIASLVLLASGFIANSAAQREPNPAITYGQQAARDFFESTVELTRACRALDTSKASLARAKTALMSCRIRYKKFSFLLDGYFPAQAKLYNSPAKFEVEEPFQESEPPQGLQEIESLLFSNHTDSIKVVLLQELTVVRESAQTLPGLLATAHPTDQTLLRAMQAELTRVMCLYIAGYDAPVLRSGIQESRAALEGIVNMFNTLPLSRTEGGRALQYELGRAIQFLAANADFVSFDRLHFIRILALPADRTLQTLLNTQKSPTDFVEVFFFPDLYKRRSKQLQLITLGKKLFQERRLSGNQLRSCASCHRPANYFADGLVRNVSADQQQNLPRNTPTLLYAAMQSSQFWDGRAASLVDQFHTVLSSPTEMNGSDSLVLARLNADEYYRRLFANGFGGKSETPIRMNSVGAALIAYLETLAPANSAFDRYMRGVDGEMTADEKAGFNLFMGKAQCGTCHFFPVFNGATPPAFARSEFEVIGVPSNADMQHPLADTDEGRFGFFPAPSYRGAFKTPTVRNSAMTNPYMHNGALPTLADVVTFYNLGGGRGIGLSVPNQTFAADSLQLTKREQQQLVKFLESLTDRIPSAEKAGHKGG